MRNWTPWGSREAKPPDTRAASHPPAAPDATANRSQTPEAALPTEPVHEGSRSSVKVSTKRLEADEGTRGKKTDSSKSPPGLAAEKKSSTETKSTPPKGDTAHAAPEKAKDGPGSSTDDPEENLDKTESFKKHDHVEYVELIKSRANELIKKQRDCTLARLCRNSVTDEWSLAVYVAQQKTFSFVVYAWDEIDEKWENSYVSEKRPAAQLEHHLRFSSAGKECTDLKGSPR
jgi:hypothetical protein